MVVLQFNNGCFGPLRSCGYSSGSCLTMGLSKGVLFLRGLGAQDSVWTKVSVWDGPSKEIFQDDEHRMDSTKAGGISPE